MSTIVVLKESDVLILGADSRYMKADGSSIGGNMKKIVEIAEQTFIVASGWLFGCDFEQAKARELASKLATTDIRIIGEALRREFAPYLKDLVETSYSVAGLHTYNAGGQGRVREQQNRLHQGRHHRGWITRVCCVCGERSEIMHSPTRLAGVFCAACCPCCNPALHAPATTGATATPHEVRGAVLADAGARGGGGRQV
jgi:hypothetical protein